MDVPTAPQPMTGATAPTAVPAKPANAASAGARAAAPPAATASRLEQTRAALRPSPAPSGKAARPATPAPVSTPATQPIAAPALSAEPAESAWAEFFRDWPEQITKRGIVVSKQNEPSPFKSFMLRGSFVLFERISPDSMGGRFLVLPFEEIAAVKFTDPLKQPALEASGFSGALAQ